MATQQMHDALPALADDDLIGKVVEHVVPRDQAPDLRFQGTLIASAAPDSSLRGRWHEYRIYRTASGNLICSKIGRSILEGERDKFETFGVVRSKAPGEGGNARLYELNGNWLGEASARDKIERDRITAFFGWGELAKQLYEKAGFETDIVID